MRRFILCLDGGGLRGLIAARVLEHVEALLSSYGVSKPLYEIFDLVAGTSAGAIVSAALTFECRESTPHRIANAAEVAKFFLSRASEIFPTAGALGELRRLVRGWKHGRPGVDGVFDRYFGDAVLSAARAPLLVPAYNLGARATKIFSSAPSLPVFDDRGEPFDDYKISDVLKATTAAPLYFAPAEIMNPRSGVLECYTDGGVFMNNPIVAAYRQALLNGWGDDEIFILSVGSGQETSLYTREIIRKWGLVDWVWNKGEVPLLSIMMDGQSSSANEMITDVLSGGGAKRVFRVDRKLDANCPPFDDSSDRSIKYVEGFAQATIQLHRRELAEFVKIVARHFRTENLAPVA